MSEFKGLAALTEAEHKQFLAYLFAQGSEGIATDGVLAGLVVLQTSTASASVNVGRGMAVVQDSLLDGVTPLVSNATKALNILGTNPMGATPRNDIVVFDAATESIRNIVGTPNAVPTDPSVPASAVPLARLRHAASATTVPTAKIDDLRVFTGLFGSFAQTSISAAGSVAFPVTAAGVTRSVAVTFPAGRFTAAPKVVAQNPTNFGSNDLQIWVTSRTATGCTINAYRHSTSWGPVTVDWIAVQSL